MADRPNIRKRSRPGNGPAVCVSVDVDRDVASRGQALVEQAIEASVAEAEAGGGGDRYLPPASAAVAASPQRAPGKKPGKKRAGGDYLIGKGKPPKHGQFKKGTSGNPNGRLRKKKEKPEDRLEGLLAEIQTVNVNGVPTRMTMQEIGERHIVQNYAKGDLKTMNFVHQTIERSRARKAAEAQSADDGLLQAPSAEVLQMLAEAKAAELKAASGLPDLSEAQIAIILAIFGMGPDSGKADAPASDVRPRAAGDIDEHDQEDDDDADDG